MDLPNQFLAVLKSKDFTELRFTANHADEAGQLPAIHADPFDRGLVAQARVEKLMLLTSDRFLQGYDVGIQFV